jgi:hypothetical protein
MRRTVVETVGDDHRTLAWIVASMVAARFVRGRRPDDLDDDWEKRATMME